VELAGHAERELDAESAGWLRRLSAGDGVPRQEAERELHTRLLRIALAEVNRRSASTPVTGPELTDVAHQAAGDAMLAILAKLGEFRGESRFITWAYRFVILEVSSKLGRHYWRNPTVTLDAGQWERLPDRLGIDPAQQAESAGILAEVRRVVDDELTAHQRRIFVAIVVDGIPLDALAARLGLKRNAMYKVIFDARRKIRRELVAKGYLDEPRLGATTMSDLDRIDQFLRTDPRDVGCDEAMAVLHVYVDLTVADQDAAGRYRGVAAHLAACGPCGEDFAGLLTAVTTN
jgi:RNA polymerase sigma-70 factor, ECF subfamily